LIEPAMFFLAGLLVAGLAGLLILPAFAARAYRLAAARARLLAPMSMKDVVAERDLLRAEHAIEQHRLERRLATVQDAGARDRAELGRQAANIVALEGEAGKLADEISHLRAQLDARERDIRGLEGEIGAGRIALHDHAARLDRAYSEIAALNDRRLALETTADDQRTVIAGLETRAVGLEMKADDALQAAKSIIAASDAEKARLSSEIATHAKAVTRMTGELLDAQAKNAKVAKELAQQSAKHEKTRRRLAEIEASAAARGTPEGDAALRQAISQLAADVVRLSGAGEGPASQPAPAKAIRRESEAPPTQGPADGEAAPARFRRLQSIVPRR
jgi:chromosome segregation ATPase